ncbi:MAG: radical SAM protein, partial [Candidatus Rokuibacteriota bacterium]
RAVQGVEGNGQRSNCGRTNKDGIDFTKADGEGFERYLALYQTPQEHGGCKGCRFFLMCKGQCPGTAIDGDWRNRTEHCELWKQLYRQLEEEMLEAGRNPVSARPERKQVEQVFLESWAAGRNVNIASALRQLGGASSAQGAGALPPSTSHGDHTDTSLLTGRPAHVA